MEQIHGDHRKRMRERFSKFGMDTLLDHEVLEMLLYYSVSRADTNPLAHRLLKEFGSLDAVLKACPEDLLKVEGLGPSGAMLIDFCNQLMRRCEIVDAQNSLKNRPLTSVKMLAEYLKPLFSGLQAERAVVLCLDNKGRPVCTQTISEGTVNAAMLHVRKIVEVAVRYNAAGLVLAHNHPRGDARPSREDLVLTRRIEATLQAMELTLADHLIFAEDEYISLRQTGLLGQLG